MGQLVLPLVFFSLLTVTLVRAAGVYLQLGTLGVGAVVIVLALDGLLPMLRNWIELDTHKVEGSLNGHYFHLLWHEVLAALGGEEQPAGLSVSGYPRRYDDAAAAFYG